LAGFKPGAINFQRILAPPSKARLWRITIRFQQQIAGNFGFAPTSGGDYCSAKTRLNTVSFKKEKAETAFFQQLPNMVKNWAGGIYRFLAVDDVFDKI
jgi:hypothetical protein